MKQSGSSRKTNERARETVANILLFDISDPRLSQATVTGCEVSFDKSVCNVYYSSAPGSYEETAAAFEGARGRIRSLMARRLSWRVVPELRFLLDDSVDEAERIGRAILRERDRMAAAAAPAQGGAAQGGEAQGADGAEARGEAGERA